MSSRPISDCTKLFESLPSKLGLKLLRRGGKRAATIIRDEAASRAPRRKGDLSENMMIRTRKEDDTAIEIEIGPAKEQFYGRFVDKGTKHMHARPFLEASADDKFDEAAAVFGVELDAEIMEHFNG